MALHTLISAADLLPHLADPAWVVVDCRYALADAAWGQREYRAGHIPGAVYADLKRDLSDPAVPRQTGRHPLPTPAALAVRLGVWGIDAQVQVVAYDAAGGALTAARLWWLLRWLGHAAVAVLDGGWQGWQAAGYPTVAGNETHVARQFTPQVQAGGVVDSAAVQAALGDPAVRLFDARAADRYRGENETIDPVAGHIPTAHSLPYAANLAADGYFLPPAALRARFAAALGALPAADAIYYCGSGVTAAHNLLAAAHAGLDGGRLYAGSWSEWITDPQRPIATGADASSEF
ncbi:MAG: sulfurtransferase [Chloroflexota bacterium]|nr:sulfurtransferase [Chloroflexota bacterium]